MKYLSAIWSSSSDVLNINPFFWAQEVFLSFKDKNVMDLPDNMFAKKLTEEWLERNTGFKYSSLFTLLIVQGWSSFTLVQ